jgi:hypothetical protein
MIRAITNCILCLLWAGHGPSNVLHFVRRSMHFAVRRAAPVRGSERAWTSLWFPLLPRPQEYFFSTSLFRIGIRRRPPSTVHNFPVPAAASSSSPLLHLLLLSPLRSPTGSASATILCRNLPPSTARDPTAISQRFVPTGDHSCRWCLADGVRRRSPLPPPIVFTLGRAPRAIISDAGASI